MKGFLLLIAMFATSFSFAAQESPQALLDAELELRYQNAEISFDDAVLVTQLSSTGMAPIPMAKAIAKYLGVGYKSVVLTGECVITWFYRKLCYLKNPTDEGDQACTDKYFATMQRACHGKTVSATKKSTTTKP